MPQTLGEYRVGIGFNPSDPKWKQTPDPAVADLVAAIKRSAAHFIDLVATIRSGDGFRHNEVVRLKDLAMTDIETAAMHAVKAATKPKPE